MLTVRNILAPAAWVEALVNNDTSGFIEDQGMAEELNALYEWQDSIRPWYVVDVARDEHGEPKDPFFSWAFHLYGGTTRGGTLQEYVIRRPPINPEKDTKERKFNHDR